MWGSTDLSRIGELIGAVAHPQGIQEPRGAHSVKMIGFRLSLSGRCSDGLSLDGKPKVSIRRARNPGAPQGMQIRERALVELEVTVSNAVHELLNNPRHTGSHDPVLPTFLPPFLLQPESVRPQQQQPSPTRTPHAKEHRRVL